MRHLPVPPAPEPDRPRRPLGALTGLLLAAATILSTVPGTAHAATAPTDVYEGQVNGQRIVLRLPTEGESAASGPAPEERGARYHERDDGLDRPLTVIQDADRVILRGAGNTPVFEGTLTPDGLRGTWRTNGEGQPALLRPVTTAELMERRTALLPSAWFEGLRQRDPYLFLKLSRPLELLGSIRHDGVEYQRWREPLSGVVFPRLPGNDGVNAALQDWQLRSAAAALTCAAQSGEGRRAWQQLVRVTLASSEVLSVRSSTRRDCGDGLLSDTDARTYDLATGRSIDLVGELGEQAPRAAAEHLAQGACRNTKFSKSALQKELVASMHPQGILLELRTPANVAACAANAAPAMLTWDRLRTRRGSVLTRASRP